MTQQNSALVEESAAAADSLREQAMKLAGVVATFRLAGAPAAVPAVAPPVAAPVRAAAPAISTVASAKPASKPIAAPAKPPALKKPAPPQKQVPTLTRTVAASPKPSAKAPAPRATESSEGDWESF
jgi:methyl-accepting chemotaxis protein